MNHRLVRFTRLLLVSSLVFSALLISAPVSPVSAARPVCATSKKAKLLIELQLSPDSVRDVWVRACVRDNTLTFEGRQKNFGVGPRVEPVIEGSLKVTVYSTSTNGRFLRDVIFEDTIWFGDLARDFMTGASNRRGRLVYSPSAPLGDVKLPDLAPGVYQVGFELTIDHTDNAVPSSSTGVRYLKVKV